MTHTYKQLKEFAIDMNKNYTNYLTNKMHYFAMSEIKEEAELKTLLKKIFDKTDLKSDE